MIEERYLRNIQIQLWRHMEMGNKYPKKLNERIYLIDGLDMGSQNVQVRMLLTNKNLH